MTEIETIRYNHRRQFAAFCGDESGATAIEYAIIASGIGAFLAATVFALGGKVSTMFTSLSALFP
jgi:pilus assembly protein Flp/PilA